MTFFPIRGNLEINIPPSGTIYGRFPRCEKYCASKKHPRARELFDFEFNRLLTFLGDFKEYTDEQNDVRMLIELVKYEKDLRRWELQRAEQNLNNLLSYYEINPTIGEFDSYFEKSQRKFTVPY